MNWSIGFIRRKKDSDLLVMVPKDYYDSRCIIFSTEDIPYDIYNENEIIGVGEDSFKDGKFKICHFSKLKRIIKGVSEKKSDFHYDYCSDYFYENNQTEKNIFCLLPHEQLYEIAKLLSQSEGSQLSLLMRNQGFSKILWTDWFYRILKTENEMESSIDNYVWDYYYKRNGHNFYNRNIEIETKTILKVDHPFYGSSYSTFSMKNNTFFPDNYLNKLLHLRVIPYLTNSDRDEDIVPFCETIDLAGNRDKELEESIRFILYETFKKAEADYDSNEHEEFLKNEVRHMRFLLKCRSKIIYDNWIESILRNINHTEKNILTHVGSWRSLGHYLERKMDISDISDFNVQ